MKKLLPLSLLLIGVVFMSGCGTNAVFFDRPITVCQNDKCEMLLDAVFVEGCIGARSGNNTDKMFCGSYTIKQ